MSFFSKGVVPPNTNPTKRNASEGRRLRNKRRRIAWKARSAQRAATQRAPCVLPAPPSRPSAPAPTLAPAADSPPPTTPTHRPVLCRSVTVLTRAQKRRKLESSTDSLPEDHTGIPQVDGAMLESPPSSPSTPSSSSSTLSSPLQSPPSVIPTTAVVRCLPALTYEPEVTPPPTSLPPAPSSSEDEEEEDDRPWRPLPPYPGHVCVWCNVFTKVKNHRNLCPECNYKNMKRMYRKPWLLI